MTLYLILVYPYDNRRDNNFVFNYIHTPGTSVQIIKATLKKYKFPCQIYSTHFYVIIINRLEIVLVQFQYNRLYRKLSYLYRNILAKFKSQYYIDRIIESLVSKIFSLIDKFHMIISTKMASQPYIET